MNLPEPWNTGALLVGCVVSVVAWAAFGVCFGWAVGAAEGFVRHWLA